MAGQVSPIHDASRYYKMSETPEVTDLKNQLVVEPAVEPVSQPFFYEIHVKGGLSREKWTAWFDNLTVTPRKGETVLRGTLQDHAALYGLIGRLRDLAIPLLSVKVLDAEAQRLLQRRSRRYNVVTHLLLLLVYLLLMGGLIAFTVLATEVIHVALALAMLFAMLGGLAYAFFIWYGGKFWRFLSYSLWLAAAISFVIYPAVAEIVHPAIAVMTMLFLMAGGVIYLLYYVRGRSQEMDDILVEWDQHSRPAESMETDGPVDPTGVITIEKEELPE
jgi:hypothetical protein